MCEALAQAKAEVASETRGASGRARAAAPCRSPIHGVGKLAAGVAHELGTPPQHRLGPRGK